MGSLFILLQTHKLLELMFNTGRLRHNAICIPGADVHGQFGRNHHYAASG